MDRLIRNLKVGVSGMAVASWSLVGTAALAQQSVPASAQDQNSPPPGSALPPEAASGSLAPGQTNGAPPSDNTKEIVVTGTSIRGVAPVGSNLISVGAAEIAKVSAPTTTELLQSVPALSNFGQSGRGGNGNGGVGASVYIHQIGASAQNSTLILVDGHRLPPSGVTSSVVDPNNIPPVMIERVEVLAEGASSIYGSDAVAGVVNFITRRNFEGVEVKGQTEFIRGASPSKLGSILAGHKWDTGSVVFGAQYSWEGELTNTDRPFTNPLGQPARAAAAGLSGTGATNFGNFNCSPATVQPNGSGNIYPSPTSTTGVPNVAANQPCSQWAYGSLIPQEKRINAMLKVRQDVTDRLSVNVDAVYNKRVSTSIVSRGTLTAFAFGPGSAGTAINGNPPSTVQAGQVNPFYVNGTGVAASREQIRYDFNQLFGPGATTSNGDETLYGTVGATYKLFGDWEANALGMIGRSLAYQGQTNGVVNTSLGTLFLNGSTQASGNTAAQALPGQAGSTTGTVVTTAYLPLTTANALDVWNPAATNQTSAATRAALLDSNNINQQRYTVGQAKAYASGSVFNLPAGPLKLAVGIEYLDYHIVQQVTNRLAIANSSAASQFFNYSFRRNVFSQYAEANIPVISPEMNIPFVHRFDLTAAVRHDKYSDFGNTVNPKGGFNWDVFDGLKLRGNISQSFVAPGLNVIGQPYGNANFSGISTVTNNVNVPLANYPTLRAALADPNPNPLKALLPACSATAATCNINALQGIQGNVGDPNNGPQKGHGWTLGADFTPHFLPGLRVSGTYWKTTFNGGITNPAFNITVNTASIAQRVIFYPQCATNADVAATVGTQPVLNVFPACISYIGIGNNGNYLNFFVQGIDASIDYTFKTGIGQFEVGGDLTKLVKYDEAFGARGQNPPQSTRFSVKNTVGLNTTFPNVGTQMRGHLGWSTESISADVFANYTGSYKNVSGTAVNPIVLNANGYYSGQGGDRVKSNTTIDANLGYRFNPGFVGQTQVQVRVRNLFDKKPPYFNSSQGYDTYVGNIIGRTIALSIDVKL